MLLISRQIVLCVLFVQCLCVKENKVPTQNKTAPTEVSENEHLEEDHNYSKLTWSDHLRHHLLTNYDRVSRPVQSHLDITTVALGLAVTHVTLDEEDSTIDVNAWVRMQWRDEKLQWNESEFGNIAVMHFAQDEIWIPDIVLYNNAAHSDVGLYHATHAIVSSNGYVLWVPPGTFYAHCQINLIRWPYDEQHCQLRFGSWTRHGFQVDLQLFHNSSKVEKLNVYTENTEWELVSGTAERNVMSYECCEEPYPEIIFKIHIRRRSPAYKAIVIVPGVVVALLTLSVFWLPPTSGEKITLCCVNLIITALFLLYFTQKLPAMGDHIPLIILFFTNTFVLLAICIVISVIVLNLTRTRRPQPAPWILKSIFTSCIGYGLGLGHIIPLVSRTHTPLEGVELRSTEDLQHKEDLDSISHVTTIPKEYSIPIQYDWLLIATGIDRIAFLSYCVITAVLLALFV